MNKPCSVAVVVWALSVAMLSAASASASASDAADGDRLETSRLAGAQDTHFVRIPAEAAAAVDRLGLNPMVNIDYGPFAWLELTADERARLSAAGVTFDELDQPFTIQLGGLSFDPAYGEPILSAAWDSARATGPDLHLVQFNGPILPEWIENLENSGMRIVQYIPPFTYIVWGEANDRDNLRGGEMVRWTGSFAPAYRVLPQLRQLPDEPQQVKVLLYRGTDTDAVVQAIEALGGELTTRGNVNSTYEIAAFTLPGSAIQAAARIPGVYSIHPVHTDGGLRGEMSDQVCANNVAGNNQAFPGYPDWLAEVGVDGSGVILADVDGGVQNNHPDLIGRLIACNGQTCGGGATSGHGTHTAGIIAGDGASGVRDGYGFLRGLGVAPGANLVEQVYSPYYNQSGGMILLMRDSYNNGAYASGNSWGPSGSPQGYDDDTLQVDVGARDTDPNTPGDQPLLYVLSIMNGYGGYSSQGTPDEAKNIFTIGSTKMQNSNGSQILQINDLSSNSAHGPCLDGRKIPHMVAPGCNVDSTYSSSGYTTMCGTSMASPHVTGAAGLFVEYYRNLPEFAVDPSPAMTKAAFLPVAHDLAGNDDADGGTLGHPFDNKQGWGRMDLEAVVDPRVEVRYFDNPVILGSTGEEWVEAVSAADPTKPLKVMLVWTDAPGHGLGGSSPAWNNDLDLVVENLSNTYRGNNFAASGWSQTGGSADYRNNTEGVFIGPTASGVYEIRVIAANINSDGLPNSGDATDQDFAVVCYNCGPGGPQPPSADDVEVSTPTDTPVAVLLVGDDDGLPDPPAAMTYVITALPGQALRDAGDNHLIIAGELPYSLIGDQVSYEPGLGYSGPDSFSYVTNDGGTPPEGGDSSTAAVSITVGGPAWDPVAYDAAIGTGVGVPADIALSALDPNGDPLTYVIESLPEAGALTDPGGGAIDTVPHTLAGGGNIVNYLLPYGQPLDVAFTFTAHDATAGSNLATVSVGVGTTPHEVYTFDLNQDPGWATQGLWAFGQPTGGGTHGGDPGSGYTGDNVYGYNLNGDYSNNMPEFFLTTTAIDCTYLVGTELRFHRWLGIESSIFDHARIQVSDDGTSWTNAWVHAGGAMSEESWSAQAYDISAVADGSGSLYIRWGMGTTDYSATYPGWNIDDIVIWGVDTTPVPPPCEDNTFTPGNVNLDLEVNGLDVGTFVEMLLNPDGPWTVEQVCAADFNASGDVDPADIDLFVLELVTTGP